MIQPCAWSSLTSSYLPPREARPHGGLDNILERKHSKHSTASSNVTAWHCDTRAALGGTSGTTLVLSTCLPQLSKIFFRQPTQSIQCYHSISCYCNSLRYPLLCLYDAILLVRKLPPVPAGDAPLQRIEPPLATAIELHSFCTLRQQNPASRPPHLPTLSAFKMTNYDRIQLLNVEVDHEGVSDCRLLVDGKSFKYIAIDPGV